MIILEEKQVSEYIKDIINDIKLKPTNISEVYHHNCDYKQAPSICMHGILSLNELNNLGITNYSNELLIKLNDTESHINGNNAISLSKVGLTDLYKSEEEYNPFNPSLVDFIVSGEVNVRRSTLHYGNEFLVNDKIDLKYLMALDIRLLTLIEKSKNNPQMIKTIIEKFNYLKNIAIAMKNSCNDIPIREKSFENISLDIEKLSNIQKIKLK